MSTAESSSAQAAALEKREMQAQMAALKEQREGLRQHREDGKVDG